MQQKPAITRVKIHDIIQARWSPRAFDPDKPVSHDDLLALLEAAHWAPSCFNDQPWRFVVCDKATDATGWQHAFSVLAEKKPAMGEERTGVDTFRGDGKFQS